VADIKSTRKEWLAHILRLEGNRATQKNPAWQTWGKRRIGGTRLRWLDAVDLRNMGVRQWTKTTKYR
jgi:hypothetical protein